MQNKKIILVNIGLIAIMAFSGIYFGVISGSRSIITDGIVSFVIFGSSSIGLYVQKRISINDYEAYPYGKWRFQDLYNLFRMIMLMMIIIYSLFEAIFTIYHYLFDNIIPPQVDFGLVFPYFIIKISTVAIALFWLNRNKSKLSIADYKIEFTSVLVDGILTFAILVGIVVFANIKAIEEIADSITLLIIASILSISIYKELKHTINLIIGKRVHIDMENLILEVIRNNNKDFHFEDVYVEHIGSINNIYITCNFEDSKTSADLISIQKKLENLLVENDIANPRIQFHFK